MTDDVKTHKPEEEPAPLVDEALAATDRNAGKRQGLAALQAEESRLEAYAQEASSRAKKSAIDDIRQYIRSQPLAIAASVGIAAFVYGLSR
ncbi:hypothetical protein [Rhizobium sp. Root483D2]|uniref:hypothetical protein n=1 Tax=Rhizobium sp. Root483D2 TaxID=1736545 RepID=UPI0007150F6B|nr:hypothetical protein [Rhizobium sp. Root483D2]KQY45641.1 hypothetical protein ASD32_10480 [Rhizobium sp. Root483D2]